MDSNVLKMLSKQAPRDLLRPIGINDNQIPMAMDRIFKIKPMHFSMRGYESMVTFLTNLTGDMQNVRRRLDGKQLNEFTQRFFSKSAISTLAAGGESGKWYGE